VFEYYKIKPIVLIDEYDQPIISSFTNGYHSDLKSFFSSLYGSALKSQECLHRALLTGIQRVVKESIFSQLNNIRVYTVVDGRYSGYFGFDEGEARELLSQYGLELDEPVKQRYDGYVFGDKEMYNPWSILNYADLMVLSDYWVNTSTNALVHSSLAEADEFFLQDFDRLINEGTVEVSADLTCSFIELRHNDTLWGLLINSGYLTVIEHDNSAYMTVRIPNGEVRAEFVKIVANRARLSDRDLNRMFNCLFKKDMDGFMNIYRQLVISCTSYYDAKENAYHMLFLGMCITLRGIYRISSNIESGHGRSDILMESLSGDRPHVVIEFKQGEDVETLKDDALRQILDNRYYEGLRGEVLCMGVAHDKKRCALAHETITNM
ncbi:MAG: ATP-binding protein, partial [Oscillospiraceae bacterium]|nr:ATP-binding protein [Oscillospiraceae bacterium]